MSANGIRSIIDDKQLALGTMLFEMFTPGIGHIVKNAGCDFAIADMEHSGLDFSQLKSVIRYFEAADLPSVVRVPTSRADHLARALDLGADALMIPMVGTADEARQIVDAVKFHPQGQRGIAHQLGHDRYTVVPVRENLDASNRRTCILAQIETAEGVENAEAIGNVEGIDCLWLGHGDLSASLGRPGDFGSDAYKTAFDELLRASKASDTVLGRLVGSVAEGQASYDQGFRLICYSADVKLLYGALKAGLADIAVTAEGQA